MTELILHREQSELIAEVDGPVVVRDENEREVGILTPLLGDHSAPLSVTPEDVAELTRRLSDDCRDLPTTVEVLEKLRSQAAS